MPVATKPRPPVTTGAVTAYAEAVLAGGVVVGTLVRLACERHMRDLVRTDLVWDAAASAKAIRFFSYLTLFETGQPFNLQPWQAFIVGSLFGWKLPDGRRRYRESYVEVARGSGKSRLAAGVGLYALVGLKVRGSQVYSAATTRDQAKIVFGDAQRFVSLAPELNTAFQTYMNSLTYKSLGSVFRPLAAESNKMDGLRPIAALVDELHEHPNDGIVSKLRSGMGKFIEHAGLLFMITTAGYNRHSVCWQQHDYSVRVLERIVDDDATFAYIATIDPGDDWRDEACWPKANPNLGVSIGLETLRQDCEQAKAIPGQQNTFKRMRLNIWTEQADRWLDLALWDEQPPRRTPAELEGAVCWVGVDLSTKVDITALEFLFPDNDGGYDLFSVFFVPEENIQKRADRDRVPYPLWAEQGLLIATPGNVVDYEYIRAYLNTAQEKLGFRFEVREVAFDPWNASGLQTQLMADGFEVVDVGQGYRSLTDPTKEFERLLLGHKLRHGGHPVLRWMAANVAVAQDPAGNLKPAKDKSTERIDGIVAAIMAVGRAMVNDDGRSVYEDREEGFAFL